METGASHACSQCCLTAEWGSTASRLPVRWLLAACNREHTTGRPDVLIPATGTRKLIDNRWTGRNRERVFVSEEAAYIIAIDQNYTERNRREKFYKYWIEFYFQFFWLGAEKRQRYVMVLSRGVMLVERLIFFGKEFFLWELTKPKG